jgi:hypothetical protein
MDPRLVLQIEEQLGLPASTIATLIGGSERKACYLGGGEVSPAFDTNRRILPS